MERGTGLTNNKFYKRLADKSVRILEVGNAPHQFTVTELKEIVAIYEPEEKNVAPPNAKRGPGRPRKVDRAIDPTGEVHTSGTEGDRAEW